MKKHFAITILVCCVLCFMSGCGRLDEQGKQCLLDVKKGLQSRWDFTNAEYKSYEEYQSNILKGVEAELSVLEEYRDTSFENDKFAAIIDSYISALESQKEGITYMFTDTEKYNKLFIEHGLLVRSECLQQLEDKYDLSVDSNYKSTFDTVLEGSYTPVIAPNQQVKFETEYGEIGVKFIEFEILTNPSEEKELVIYCEMENVSYYDEWNGETILFDYFMGVYDGAQYNIEFKDSAHDYIDGFKECMGCADLRKGEKGKFAILCDYSDDIDIIKISFGGTDDTYCCYLTSKSWKAKNSTAINGKQETVNVDYSVVREQMSNFSCNGMYNIYDGWVYSLNFPEGGGSGIFSKMRTDGTDYTILTEKGTPYYIYIDGEYIYSTLSKNRETKIYRCRLGGNDLTQLTTDDVCYLQVTDDYLYYDKQDVSKGITLGFYRANKDGSNEVLIMDKEIYYSYVVGDVLYYQDDNDNETIHKYNLTTKVDEKITSAKSYGFVVDGEYGFYIQNDHSTAEGDMIGSLVKIDLKTKEETVLYDGVSTYGIVVGKTEVYFINANDKNRIYCIGKDGKGVKLVSQDTYCTSLAIFGDKLMYTDYDDNEEYIEAIYLCEKDGSNKVKISKID